MEFFLRHVTNQHNLRLKINVDFVLFLKCYKKILCWELVGNINEGAFNHYNQYSQEREKCATICGPIQNGCLVWHCIDEKLHSSYTTLVEKTDKILSKPSIGQ